MTRYKSSGLRIKYKSKCHTTEAGWSVECHFEYTSKFLEDLFDSSISGRIGSKYYMHSLSEAIDLTIKEAESIGVDFYSNKNKPDLTLYESSHGEPIFGWQSLLKNESVRLKNWDYVKEICKE